MKRVRGDSAINRAAASGPCTYLFQGKRYYLEPGKVYATRIQPDGSRTIVVLLLS